jgi:hypothetical protein
MAALVTKRQILADGGYTYSFDRKIYINRRTKKVFSIEFIEDHNEEELQRCITENTQGGRWRFYFNSQPPEAVKRELEGLLG